MATVLLAKQGTPPVPSTGDVRFWISTANEFCSINDAGLITVYGESLTQEQVQDFVGAMFADTSTVNATYNDAGNAVTFDVIAGGVNHDGLLNFVANKHIDHSTISISAGTGLTGGGDLTATRTLSLANVGIAGSYGAANQIPVFTTDVQGRVTNVTNTTITGVPAANIVVTPSGNISSTNVGAALTELDSEKIAVTEKGAANGVCPLGSDSKISSLYLPSYVDDVLEYANLAAFPVTGETGKIYVAIDTNKTYRWSGSAYIEVSASPVTSVFTRTGNVVATNGDYTAAQITNAPSGTITSTTLQNAVNELDTNKVPTTRQIIAGTGLSGGGALSGNVTVSMPAVGTANTYGSASSVPVFTTDAQGRVSSVTNTAVAVTSGNVTDFAEAVQDAVGGILTDTASVDFTYNDALNTITAAVLPAGVDHNSLSNFVSNKHIDHSAVSITAGTGLSGGGDLTTTRTLSIPNSGVTAASYGTASQIPVFTVNALGFVTSATNTSVSIPASQVTDFSEAVDDRVAALLQNGTGLTWTYNDPSNTLTANVSLAAFTTTNLAEGANLYYTDARARASHSATDSASIDFTYTSSTGVLTGVVLPAGVDHNALNNYSANRHIDHSTVSLVAGTGISATGLGDLTASRTINLANTSVTAAAYGSATQVAGFTVDAQGRLTAASNTTIAIPSTQITDFALNNPPPNATGQFIYWLSTDSKWHSTTGGWAFDVTTAPANGQLMQWSNTGSRWTMSGAPTANGQFLQWNSAGTGQWQAVALTTSLVTEGSNLYYTDTRARAAHSATDSSSIDFTYTPATGVLTGVVLPAGVDHNALSNFVANKHIDHSTVSVTAGTGLSGGGDLTASRTISMPNVGTAGIYGSSTQFPIITTDAQGRVSSVALNTITSSYWSVDTSLDPGGLLTWSDQTAQELCIRQANDGIGSSYIRQVNSRGTLAAPAAMLSGDRIGGHGYYGWNSGGANELPSAAFTGYATENHAPTAQGGELRIEVIPNGTVTPVDAVYIRNNRLLEVTNGILLSDSTDTTNGVMRINGGAAQVRQNGAWKPVVEPLQTALQSSQLTSSSNSTLTNIAGLEFSVTAGRTYRIQIYIMYRSAAMSTGLALTLGNTGAVGTLAATATMTNVSDGTSANFFGAITAFGDVATSTAVPIINTDYLAKIEGIFVCTASGTIVPRFRSETNGTQVTVQIGSNIEVREF